MPLERKYLGRLPEPFESQENAIVDEIHRVLQQPQTEERDAHQMKLGAEKRKIREQGIKEMGGLTEINRKRIKAGKERVKAEKIQDPETYQEKEASNVRQAYQVAVCPSSAQSSSVRTPSMFFEWFPFAVVLGLRLLTYIWELFYKFKNKKRNDFVDDNRFQPGTSFWLEGQD